MKTLISAIALVGLTGCATAEAPLPEHGSTPGYTCSGDSLAQFRGRQASAELGAEMLRVSGARVIRWVNPGQAVTMDFSPQRLTVHLDASGRVESASCG